METIRIRSSIAQDVTIIENEFLDRFLPAANGEFLKIYLCLLRLSGVSHAPSSISSIADRMNCTESDVERALRYWEKVGVLALTRDDAGEITDISFTGSAGTSQPLCTQSDAQRITRSSEITSERMTELGSREDIRELFFIAQQYLGKPLSRSEMQKICFFYDSLHFSPDLIDYLIEYCVSRGHKSFHYIEKVALNWKEQGISCVRDARVAAGSYHREYYDILKALGIDNHHPVEAEIRIMKKWIEKYSFPMDLIQEACTRTVMGASRPTLSYVDSILSKWYARGVHSLDDVRALDEEHRQNAAVRKSDRLPAKKAVNGFVDFEQRDYDFATLETALIGRKS